MTPFDPEPEYTLRLAPLWWFGGACLVALVIYGSLVTSGPVVETRLSDKFTHLFSYAVLGVYFGGVVKQRSFWATLLLLFTLSVGLEFLQEAGGFRLFDVRDMLFNAAGLLVAALLCRAGMHGWCRFFERWLLP